VWMHCLSSIMGCRVECRVQARAFVCCAPHVHSGTPVLQSVYPVSLLPGPFPFLVRFSSSANEPSSLININHQYCSGLHCRPTEQLVKDGRMCPSFWITPRGFDMS
jgi:hypothetical protein